MKKGFTLIELIIYISILSIIFFGLITILDTLIFNQSQNREYIEINNEVDFIISKINSLINQSKSVSFLNNTINLDNQILIFKNNGFIFIKRGINNPKELNSSKYPIQQFNIIQNEINPNIVGVYLKIKNKDYYFEFFDK